MLLGIGLSVLIFPPTAVQRRIGISVMASTASLIAAMAVVNLDCRCSTIILTIGSLCASFFSSWVIFVMVSYIWCHGVCNYVLGDVMVIQLCFLPSKIHYQFDWILRNFVTKNNSNSWNRLILEGIIVTNSPEVIFQGFFSLVKLMSKQYRVTVEQAWRKLTKQWILI